MAIIRATLMFRGKFVRDYKVDKNPIIIGRDASADIKIENKGVLPKHCKISQRGTTFLIEDLGTPQGLELNGQKIRMSQLNKGDSLSLGGNFSLVFDLPGGAQPPQSKAPPVAKPAHSKRGTGGLLVDGKPTPAPGPSPLASGKSAEFFSEATMRVSAFDDDLVQPAPMADDDIEIEPLSIGDLETLGVEGTREQKMEKISGLLISLDDQQLSKIAQILEILFS